MNRAVRLGILVMGALGLAGLGLCLGSVSLPVQTVWAALTGNAGPRETFLVVELRLPRVTGALAAGALLAWSGMLFQGLVRNPLVSPDLLGVEAGATAAVVLGIVAGWSAALTGWLAFGGAAAAALVIAILGARTGGTGHRLILVGLGINALLTAAVTFLLVQGNVYQAAKAYQWMVGSLYSTTPAEAGYLGASTVVLGALGLGFSPALRLLQLGDLGARSLGAPTRAWSVVLGTLASAMAAAAVSVVGPIGFLALAAPHAARILTGPVGPWSFLTAGALGALALLAVDLVGQFGIPGGLPAGVLAAGLGGPYFLFLLRRRGPVL
jgi:iron complex transport system permease protein